MKISEIIDRMAEIKEEKTALDNEYDKLQAQVQILAECDLTDTKIKSASYYGTNGNVACVTTSDTISVVAGELLPAVFGSVYPSMVKQEVKYTLKAPAKRILAAVWHKEYCKSSVAEIIDSLKCDEKTRKVLHKKLKGVDFSKDVDTLITYTDMSAAEASDTAYLLNEAAVWENIEAILKVNNNNCITDELLKDFATKVNAAVNVSRGIKTELKIGGDEDE